MAHDQEPAPGTAPDPVPERHNTREPIPVLAKDMTPPAPPPARDTAFTLPNRNLVPDGNILCTGDQVREWVRAALVRAGTGGPWYYDANIVMIPGARAMMTAYAIVIYVPSPLLNQEPLGVVKVVTDFPSEKQIINLVRSAVGELRDLQAATLRLPPQG